MEYSKEELGLNAKEFLDSSPNLFFSYIASKQDKNELTRYDMLKQVRMWNKRK